MTSCARIPLSALLFSVGWVSLPAAAQPNPVPPERNEQAEREVILTGAPDEPPTAVYAAANVPLALVFDGPLLNGSAVVVPGADVRPHPFLANALVLTPSKDLAAQGSSAVSVPLVDRAMSLTLTFRPERRDGLVSFVRRAAATRLEPTQDELQNALRVAAQAVLEADSRVAAFEQHSVAQGNVLLRVVMGFSYLRVRSAELKCIPTTARLVGGEEPIEALLVEPTESCMDGEFCTLMVVARTPAPAAKSYVLELMAQDGALCGRVPDVPLQPNFK